MPAENENECVLRETVHTRPWTAHVPEFGQAPSHPGLRALQDRKRQLERVVEHLAEELRRK